MGIEDKNGWGKEKTAKIEKEETGTAKSQTSTGVNRGVQSP